MRYAITKCFLCIFLVAMPVIAKADLGKETGLRVPRFVSMNSSKVNVRAGPGTRYPIKWVFQRKTLPVQIIAESDTWRKIRDFEGIEGWVHQRMLSGRRRAVVTGVIQQLKREPQKTAKTVALLEHLHSFCHFPCSFLRFGDRLFFIIHRLEFSGSRNFSPR